MVVWVGVVGVILGGCFWVGDVGLVWFGWLCWAAVVVGLL